MFTKTIFSLGDSAIAKNRRPGIQDEPIIWFVHSAIIVTSHYQFLSTLSIQFTVSSSEPQSISGMVFSTCRPWNYRDAVVHGEGSAVIAEEGLTLELILHCSVQRPAMSLDVLRQLGLSDSPSLVPCSNTASRCTASITIKSRPRKLLSAAQKTATVLIFARFCP